MSAERINLRNIKRVALAAPVLLMAAHFGCNTDSQKEPLIAPSQTSGQQDGLKTTPTTPVEQIGQDNQPTNTEIIPTNVVKQPLLNSRFQIVNLPDEAQIQITETTPTEVLKYKLYAAEFNSLNTLTSGIFTTLDNHIPDNTYLNIQNLLEEAKNVHQAQAIVMVISAAKLLQKECDPNNHNPNSIINLNMKRLASYIFATDRETFVENEQVYFSSCFWGEKANVSQ